jgi:hypothetical protein
MHKKNKCACDKSYTPTLPNRKMQNDCNRQAEAWPGQRIVIDTAGRAVEDCLAEVYAAVAR